MHLKQLPPHPTYPAPIPHTDRVYIWLLPGTFPTGGAHQRVALALRVCGGVKRRRHNVRDFFAKNADAHATREKYGAGGAHHGGIGVSFFFFRRIM